MQAASSVGVGSSRGGEALDDGERAGPSGGGVSRASDGGGEARAGPSWTGEAGPSAGGDSGMSWAGGAGPSWAGEAGPSGSGTARGERKTMNDHRDRRKRRNKSTGEVTAKKRKTSAVKKVEDWRCQKSVVFHSSHKKQDKRTDVIDKIPENPRPCKRALKRKSGHKDVPFIEAVISPDNNNSSTLINPDRPTPMPSGCVNDLTQSAKTQKMTPAKVLNLENPYEGDDDDSIAELLHGLSVRCLGDNVAIGESRRSKFEHRRLVWWNNTNWHEERRGAAEYEGSNAAEAGSRSGTAQKPESGVSTDGTANNSVPAAAIIDQQPININGGDAENAAAAPSRPSLRKTNRRAVSDSDIDVEHAQEEFQEFLLFGRRKETSESPDVSDDDVSSYSSLYSSITSSENSTDTE